MKTYFELHITFTHRRQADAEAVVAGPMNWRFSAIAGDANLGPGVKLYATKQLSTRRYSRSGAVAELKAAALRLNMLMLETTGVEPDIKRLKVEEVLFDTKSAQMRGDCGGACPECTT